MHRCRALSVCRMYQFMNFFRFGFNVPRGLELPMYSKNLFVDRLRCATKIVATY